MLIAALMHLKWKCWSDFWSIYRPSMYECVMCTFQCAMFWCVNEAIKQNYAIAQSSSYQNEQQIFIQPIRLNQSQV